MIMQKMIALLLLLFVGVYGMTDDEINALKNQLDAELAAVQSDTSKKSVDNNQVAAILKEDADSKNANTKKADDALLELLQAEKDKRDSESAMIDEMIKEAQEKDAGSEKKDAKADAASENKDAKKEADDALLELLIKEEKTQDAASKISKKEADDALIELILKEEEEKKKEVPMLVLKDESESKRGYEGKNRGKEDPCQDKRTDCQNLKVYCSSHKSFASLCPKTCGICVPCKKDTRHDCERFEKVGYCQSRKYRTILKKLCHETCGHCRAPSPPACMNTVAGCCWDMVTPASKGCPPCENKSYLKSLCPNFKEECGKDSKPGKFMQMNCPETCNPGLCEAYKKKKKTCSENDNMRENCKVWKQAGECEKNKGVQVYCDVTCGFCSRPTYGIVKK